MEIHSIFVIVRDSLYSARFRNEERNEFARLFTSWNDAVYLENFFETHKHDLLAFWQHITIEEAILATMEEANVLERKLLLIAQNGITDKSKTLSDLFKPLKKTFIKLESVEKNKAKGHRRRSWLRLYAVRLDVNLFVISGGAIKLTRTMNERAHLLTELKKLDILCDYLRDGDEQLEIVEML